MQLHEERDMEQPADNGAETERKNGHSRENAGRTHQSDKAGVCVFYMRSLVNIELS